MTDSRMCRWKNLLQREWSLRGNKTLFCQKVTEKKMPPEQTLHAQNTAVYRAANEAICVKKIDVFSVQRTFLFLPTIWKLRNIFYRVYDFFLSRYTYSLAYSSTTFSFLTMYFMERRFVYQCILALVVIFAFASSGVKAMICNKVPTLSSGKYKKWCSKEFFS